MKILIQKWGDSLALRIPSSFATEVGLEPDRPVELVIEDGRLVISALPGRSPTLADLLQGVTPENLHGEIDPGPSRGGEAW